MGIWIIIAVTAFAMVGVGSAIIWGPDNEVEKESEKVVEVIVDYELDSLESKYKESS